jgi:FkbM family methyltransferase
MYMWARKDEPNDMATNGELRLQRLVSRALAPTATLIAFDVGARVGDWSRALLEQCAERPGRVEVHAFEPVPDSRARLAESLAGHIQSGTLQVNPVALSDVAAKLPMYVPHVMAGTSTLHPDARIQYPQVLEVEASTIDWYCQSRGIEHVDLLKIDTEGNDLRVIRGAKDLMCRGAIGVIQFEYNERWVHSRSFLKDVFDLITGTPYRLAKVCSHSLEVYIEWHHELERYFETNYALVHDRFRGPLQCITLKIGGSNACERVTRMA